MNKGRSKVIETDELDLEQLPLDQLLEKVRRHHEQTLEERIPHLEALIDKFEPSNHEDESEEVVMTTSRQLMVCRDVLERHLAGEEEYLFPYVEQLMEAAEENAAAPPRPDYLDEEFENEHQEVLEELESVREVVGSNSIPDDAREEFVELDQELVRFENDVSEQLRMEEEILLDRIADLEDKLSDEAKAKEATS